MGVCWSGKSIKNYKIESKNKNKLDLTHLENNNNLFSERKNKANFILNNDKDLFNLKLDEYINQKKSLFQNDKLQKLYLEQLINIFLIYKFDFTNCEIIVNDFIENEKVNFIKSFKHINFTIDKLKNLSDEKLNLFKKFISEKKILFIIDNFHDLDKITEYLNFIIINNINIKNIYILNSNFRENLQLNLENNDNLIKLLTYINDYKLIENFPFIFPLKYFPILNKNFFIFYNYNISENFSYKYLCNKELEINDPHIKFLYDFDIKTIFNLKNGDSNLIIQETKRKKIENEEKENNKLKIITIFLNNIDNTKDKNKDDINIILNEIFGNKFVFIRNEELIDNKIIIEFFFNLFSKLTGVNFEELKNYFYFTKIPIFQNNIIDEFSKKI